MTVSEFRRAAAEASRGRGTGKRYPAPLREFAVEHAKQELANGRAMAAVARSLGVPGQTLTYWLARSGPKSPSVVSVRIRPSEREARSTAPLPSSLTTRTGIVVMTADGYRIAVGSVGEAAALVRALR